MSDFSIRSSRRAPRVKSLTLALSAVFAGGVACIGLMEMQSASATTANPSQRQLQMQHRGHRPSTTHATWTDAENTLRSMATRPHAFAASTLHDHHAVTSLSESGPGSIREAIANAADGDIVDLHGLSGTIMLTRALQPSARIVIDGPGRDVLTLDGGGLDRVINSSHDLKLSNVTIANGATAGKNANGGCLSITGYLYLSNATISNCKSGDKDTEFAYGGAAFVMGSSYVANSSITGSSVTAFHRAAGGALFVAGANTSNGLDLSVKYSTISGNSATVDSSTHQLPYGTSPSTMALGGGIANYYAPTTSMLPFAVVVGYSTVSGNTVSAAGFQNPSNYYNYYGNTRGGGIAMTGTQGLLIVSGVTKNNTASANGISFGGGIYSSSTIFGLGHAVTGNTASSTDYWSYGGGLSAEYVGLSGSTVSGNIVTSSCASCLNLGGGIEGFDVGVKYSLVSGNSISASMAGSAVDGGGIDVYDNVMVKESTISGNSAVNLTNASFGYGGGVATYHSSTVQNSTIAFNTASGHGGGLVTFGTSLQLDSTIVANNMATYDATSMDIASKQAITPTGSHDLVLVATSTVTLPAGTLSVDPKLLPLADNGGPTFTHKLDAGSPAIDAGSNPNNDTTDQRGYPHDRSFGVAPDIGAYELDTDRIFRDDFETHNTIP